MFQTTNQYVISVSGCQWYIINHNAIYWGYDGFTDLLMPTIRIPKMDDHFYRF